MWNILHGFIQGQLIGCPIFHDDKLFEDAFFNDCFPSVDQFLSLYSLILLSEITLGGKNACI